MKATRWIFVAALVPVIGLALANWLTAQKFRAENAALRAELQRQRDELAASTDAATSAASEQARELQRARADAAETLRLRGEVAQLRSGAQDAAKARAENLQLRSENQRLRTNTAPVATAEQPPPAAAANEHFPKENWTFAGYASPEAALVSAIWSMKEGNPKSYLDSLAPEEQARMAKAWENKSETEIAAKHQADVSAINGVRILERQSVSADEVTMNVYIEGVGRMDKVSMKRVGNDWKFGGFVRPPAK
jgi:hypothetical protein